MSVQAQRTARLRPTRLGAAFLGLVLLTLVGCINYSLSLGYGLTFLLGGVWIITAAQALRAIRLLSLNVLAPANALAGQPVTFTAQVQSLGPGSNVRVEARAQQVGSSLPIKGEGVAGHELQSLALSVTHPRRGPLHLSGVRLAAVDRLGLWHASLPAPDTDSVLVAPAPEHPAPPAPNLTSGGSGDPLRRTRGQEEFAGVRAYQPGDSPRLLSWKHVARTGTLLTREFDAPAGEALSLSWADTAPAGGTEARASRLAAWVQGARQSGQAFSLTLPNLNLQVGSGEGQVRTALNALAQLAPLPEPPAETAAPRPLFRPPTRPDLPLPTAAAALRFSLLALGFAMLPGVLHWPLWLGPLLLLVLGYRFIQADPARKLPVVPPLALVGMAVLVAAGLQLNYGSLLGQQAGTAILAALLALKAAETHTIRDAKLLSLLGLFLLVTNFFHSQGPLTALHTLLAAGLLLAAATRWVNPQTWRGPLLSRPAWQATARLLLLAAPVAALLFAFFPRPDGPLWRLPFQQNQTGLADEITAGEFGNLAQSNAVAFRADFGGGPIPAPAERYWRGPVYENYDGVKWTQFRRGFASPSLERQSAQPLFRYTLTLEPTGKPWLLALDTPTLLPPNTFLTSAFQAVNFRPSGQRTRYDLQSQAALLGRQESVSRLNLNLFVPAGESPRAAALAASWRNLSAPQRVVKAAEFLQQGHFRYSLNPPTLPERNRVDAFLFGTKTGFCEHYSSAFAFLMRAAGVPARIVGGYQGGEVNPGGGYLMVRQRDAHAWTEVWLQGQGWVRVDPTALIAPARINTDLSTALTQPNATTLSPRTPLQNALLRLDTFQTGWNNWVAGYDGELQRSALSRLGIGGIGSAPYLLALTLLTLLMFVPVIALVRRAARPSDPAQAALLDLTEKLGLPRQPGETASAYASRAAGAYPTHSATLQDIARLYNEIRYGQPDASLLQRLKTSIQKVRRS